MPQKFELPNTLDIPDLPKYLKQVELYMATTLGAEKSELTSAILRLTQARGKRLRPALVIACALLSGQEINNSVIKAATAVELIHIGSLVHDDIIDKALTRWNVPTINAQEGQDYAILSGDYLFAKACSVAAEVNQKAGIIAAETIARLCQGQTAELAVQYSLVRTETQLEQAMHGKTAALMAAACELGGICTNQSEKQCASLSKFGSNFGMTFQLADDVLDFVSTEALMGKPVGNDIKEGVYALPIILSLKGPQRIFIEKELHNRSSSHLALTEYLLENGSINEALARAQKYSRSAEQNLQQVFGEVAANVAKLPTKYLDWAVSNLIALKYKDRVVLTSPEAQLRSDSLVN